MERFRLLQDLDREAAARQKRSGEEPCGRTADDRYLFIDPCCVAHFLSFIALLGRKLHSPQHSTKLERIAWRVKSWETLGPAPKRNRSKPCASMPLAPRGALAVQYNLPA